MKGKDDEKEREDVGERRKKNEGREEELGGIMELKRESCRSEIMLEEGRRKNVVWWRL